MGYNKEKQEEFNNDFLPFLENMYNDFSNYFYKSDSNMYYLSFDEQLCVFRKYFNFNIDKNNHRTVTQFSATDELENMRLICNYNTWKGLDRYPKKNSAIFTPDSTLFIDTTTYGDESYKDKLYDFSMRTNQLYKVIDLVVNEMMSDDEKKGIIEEQEKNYFAFCNIFEGMDDDVISDEELNKLFNIYFLTNICSNDIINVGEESFSIDEKNAIIYLTSINILNKGFDIGFSHNKDHIPCVFNSRLGMDVYRAINELSRKVITLFREQCISLEEKGEFDYDSTIISAIRERNSESNFEQVSYSTQESVSRERSDVLAGHGGGNIRTATTQGTTVSVPVSEDREIREESRDNERESREEADGIGRISENLEEQSDKVGRNDRPDSLSDAGDTSRGNTLQTDSDFSNGNRENEEFAEQRINESKTEDISREESVVLEDTDVDVLPPINADDFSYSEDWQANDGSALERFKNNVQAIKVLKLIENNNVDVSHEQQEILSKYVGWGGLDKFLTHSDEGENEYQKELKELLTDEEYKSVLASVNSAFYTPRNIIDGIWKAVVNMGFKGGNVLEPSCAIGNFYSAMPTELRDTTHRVGVEIDSISGRIAKILHPNADIYIKGFEECKFNDNSFSLIIGNVPFGDININDRKYNKFNYKIHDYFFAKSMDLLAPNGIMAFITSKGTFDKKSDKLRKVLSEKASLVGAIRLPRGTFKASANTEVSSDILFFQKKEKPFIENVEWVNSIKNEDGVNINQFFAYNPNYMIGTMVKDTRYGDNGTYANCIATKEQLANLDALYNELIDDLPKDIIDKPMAEAVFDDLSSTMSIPANSDVKNASLTIIQNNNSKNKNGDIYYRNNDLFEYQTEINNDKKAYNKVYAYIELRNALRTLIDIQTNGCTEEELKEKQVVLKEKFDNCKKVIGNYFCDIKKKDIAITNIQDDVEFSLVNQLVTKNGNDYVFSDLFDKQVIRPVLTNESADTALDALTMSINKYGNVNMPYILSLYPRDIDEVIDELKEEIYLDLSQYNFKDKMNGWVSAEEFLSGNVREKLNLLNVKNNAELNYHFGWNYGITRTIEDFTRLLLKGIDFDDYYVFNKYRDCLTNVLKIYVCRTLAPLFKMSYDNEHNSVISNWVEGVTDDDIINDVYFDNEDLEKFEMLKIKAKTMSFDSFRKHYIDYIKDRFVKYSNDIDLEKNSINDDFSNAYFYNDIIKNNDGVDVYKTLSDYDLVNNLFDYAYFTDMFCIDNNLDMIYDNLRHQNIDISFVNEDLSDFVSTQLALSKQALEKNQPEWIEAKDINISIGCSWVRPSDYIAFIRNLTDVYISESSFSYSNLDHTFWFDNKRQYDFYESCTTKYGTSSMNAIKIFENLLNLKPLKVYIKVEDENGKEKRVIDEKASTLARAKGDIILDKFSKWIFADETRKTYYENYYNEHFNNLKIREYNGDNLEFEGMNMQIQLKPHQKNAVARIIRGGNTLLGHCVGAGKSFEMICGAMELKRLKLASKPLIVVPNHLTGQMANEFNRLYPSANVLLTTKNDFEKKNRHKFIAKMTMGEYDAVVMGHSQFDKIVLSKERQIEFMENEINNALEYIEALQSRPNASRWSVKQIQSYVDKMQKKLEKLMDADTKDDMVSFESLGVDALFIDEAHEFKNLSFQTKLNNVAGINTNGSNRAFNLYSKIQYLQELNPNRNIVFATGTPISNSMCEMFTMQRYLQKSELEKKNLANFDEWASIFGQITESMELTPEGNGYRPKTRFSKFVNLPELITMFRQFADVKLADQLDLDVPQIKGGKVKVVESEPSDEVKAHMEVLVKRAELIHSGSVDPKIDNMLKICHDAKLLSTDIRLLDPDAYISDSDKNSKLYKCIDEVYRIYNETNDIKGTQVIFCDMGVPGGSSEFNVYDFIKQGLIEKGMKEDEICFIHDAKNEKQKDKMFDDINKGKKRLIIGSTSKLGTGTNIQDRLYAMHEIDVPWRPSDVEQREGRIIRQGNMNKEVEIIRYVTKGTFDAYNWNIIENKQKFISQVMTSKVVTRECEDIDETVLSYAEMKAISSNNPLLKEKNEVDTALRKLKLLRNNFLEEKSVNKNKLVKKYPEELSKNESFVKHIKEDIKIRDNNPLTEDNFCFVSKDGKEITERKEMGALILGKKPKLQMGVPEYIGKFRGFDLSVCKEFMMGEDNIFNQKISYNVYIKGKGNKHYVEISDDPVGTVTRINNKIEAFDEILANLQEKIDRIENNIKTIKEEIDKPFDKEDEYQHLCAEQKRLEIALNLSADDEDYSDEIVVKVDEDKYDVDDDFVPMKLQTV